MMLIVDVGIVNVGVLAKSGDVNMDHNVVTVSA